MKRKKLILISLLLSLIASGIHLYLSAHFYDVRLGAIAGTSLCNINTFFNCDVVSASQFASLLGIPIALFGLFTHLTLSLLLTLVYFSLTDNENKTFRYAFYLQTLTVLASIVMGIISLTQLKNACLFCIATYTLALIGFVLLYKASEKPALTLFKNDFIDLFTINKPILAIYIAIPTLAWVAHIMFMDLKKVTQVEKIAFEKVASWKIATEQKFTEEGLVLYFGESSTPSKNTIVEFADFRCPHCKLAVQPLHNFVQQHPDTQLIFKPFPLDGTCNKAITHGGDGISCALALATFCAEKINQSGWKAHDHIFSNQEKYSRLGDVKKLYEILSTELTIDVAKMTDCAYSTETIDLIKRMAAEAEEAKIHGTPSVFLNNRNLEGGQMPVVLEKAYQSILRN